MLSVEPLLGTRADVHVDASEPRLARAVEQAILDEATRLEAVFTVFDADSALSRYRRERSTTDRELAEVLALSDVWQLRSHGLFEPRMQTLIDLWDQAERVGRAPSTEERTEAIAARSGSPLDNLNAIAKGWIADHAVRRAIGSEGTVSSAWFNLGGDVVHVGTGSTRVGIENPMRPYDNAAPLATIDIADEALATSGGARRWWTIAGERYSKALDPRTGLPADRAASATVVAPDGATADVLATIALIADTEQTLSLIADANAIALIVHGDGSHTSTSPRFEVR